MLEKKLNELNDSNFYGRIASGGGRMVITMDRYEADWSMVELGWQTHVLGDARKFKSAKEAIETDRKENPGLSGFPDRRNAYRAARGLPLYAPGAGPAAVPH